MICKLKTEAVHSVWRLHVCSTHARQRIHYIIVQHRVEFHIAAVAIADDHTFYNKVVKDGEAGFRRHGLHLHRKDIRAYGTITVRLCDEDIRLDPFAPSVNIEKRTFSPSADIFRISIRSQSHF